MSEFWTELEHYGEHTALVTDSSREVSYRALIHSADEIRKCIRARAVVFLACGNTSEAIIGYVGLLRANAVIVLINATIDGGLLARLIDAYRPEYLYAPVNDTKFARAGCPIHHEGNYVLLETRGGTGAAPHSDLALLLTTSGSTGSQKFVRLSASNIDSNARAIASYLGISSLDRPITAMPMSYSFGLSIINSHLLCGASIAVTGASVMEDRFWKFLKSSRVSSLSGVPYLYEMLKKLRFDAMDLPDLRCLTQAGGKLPADLAEEFFRICVRRGISFYLMYGQTEATARMSYLPPEYAGTHRGSIGLAIPGGKFWLEDKNRKIIVGSEVEGELIYEGPNVSMGYAESWRDLSKADENKGILRTADIARRSEDGFYYIVGRASRFVKLFGNRVSLGELEQLIGREGYECACVGTDDNLKIFLTEPDTDQSLKKHLAKLTGIHPTGFTIETIRSLPRSDSGKVWYAELERIAGVR